MKSNLITKIIVTCLCMWAIGMAADKNQAIKEKTIIQAEITTQQKVTAYQNAKKAAEMKAQSVPTSLEAQIKENAYKYDQKQLLYHHLNAQCNH